MHVHAPVTRLIHGSRPQVQGAISKVPGVKSVQRVVCGGCLDYKVIVALDAGAFGAWEAKKFEPEESFLAAGLFFR